MPAFKVKFDSEAENDLDRLPSRLASRIVDWIVDCANDCRMHMRPAGFPHLLLPKFVTTIECDGLHHEITALFQFSQDETAIAIRAIACTSW